MKAEPFKFKNVVKQFDDHISCSIQNYNQLCFDIVTMSSYFLRANSEILDVGCSTSSLLKRVVDYNSALNVKGEAIEIDDCFSAFHNHADITYTHADIINHSLVKKFDLILSVFTLQFIPYQHKKNVLNKLYKSLHDRGGLIICEKILNTDPLIENMLTSMYYQHKMRNFTGDEILVKEQGLRSMLSLYNLRELFSVLQDVGFKRLEIIWKQYSFVAIVAIK